MMPPLMSNHGNYIVSLGNVCRWLATKAEALGVEIYPGFAAAEVLYDDNGAVAGVATGDMGIGKDGEPKDSFTRGMELRAKYTLFAEGARGNLGKQLIAKFGLGDGREPQKFGLGLKELWQVAPDKHRKGLVQHSFGWPLDGSTGGGSFLYHFDDNLVSVGFVVHLNYKNPYLSPFEEFQRFKTHPLVRDTFEGGKRLAYGARAITEGGYQSVPKLTFPGRRADRLRRRLRQRAAHQGQPQRDAVRHAWRPKRSRRRSPPAARTTSSPTTTRLALLRHRQGSLEACATPSRCGRSSARSLGIALGGLDMWTNTFGFSLFGTLSHGKPDYASLKPAAECTPIAYPKPDGKLTFDRLSSVFLSNTNHEEDQPPHLKVKDMDAAEALGARRLCRALGALLPGRRLRMGGGGRRAEVRHQRAELRPLQNLRHQGPEPEHHLGAAGRRRRAELSEHVIAGRPTTGHDAATSVSLKLAARGVSAAVVLAGAAQKGHSGPTRRQFARRAVGRHDWSIARDISRASPASLAGTALAGRSCLRAARAVGAAGTPAAANCPG